MRPALLLTTLAATLALAATPVVGARAKPEAATAANGIVVTIHRDTFKAQVEYGAPVMGIDHGRATYALRRSTKDGAETFLIDGFHRYKTPWRFYDRAFLAGGDPVSITTIRKDVVKCTPWGSCTVDEIFQLSLTKAQIETATAEGLPIQVASPVGGEFVITLPKAHIDAVSEVSAKQ